ncbi:hypothetical protein SLOPH_2717 [Spraguea lophii 42_110]|uniref:Uncharacterized protein n=1 Tax=Spraguea lophii (strain 42_110) TaxID=1358809 RepID=S7W7P3_SPRLO|nr:hypothetical protein SLOPH_2717 [Spraguea lophii 42_110]
MDELYKMLCDLEADLTTSQDIIESLKLEASKLFTLYSLDILDSKLKNTLSKKQLEKIKDLKQYFDIEYIPKEADQKILNELKFI